MVLNEPEFDTEWGLLKKWNWVKDGEDIKIDEKLDFLTLYQNVDFDFIKEPI